MKFFEKVLGSNLSGGHNNYNKREQTKRALESDKYYKYTDPEYRELCRADARRNIVIWSR